MTSIAIAFGLALSLVATENGPSPGDTRLDSIRIEDPRPADWHRVERYTCPGEDDSAVDAIVEHTLATISPTEHRSRVDRIRIADRELTPEELDDINDFASAGTIQGSSASCWSTGIRVIIVVFDPDLIERGGCLDDAKVFVPIHFDRRTGVLDLP